MVIGKDRSSFGEVDLVLATIGSGLPNVLFEEDAAKGVELLPIFHSPPMSDD